MMRERRVWLALFVIVPGFVLAIAFHYYMDRHQNLGYPYDTFLFLPSDAGMDFFNILEATRGLDPYESKLAVYFPLTYVPFALLTPLPPELAFGLFSLFFVAVTVWFAWRQLDFLNGMARRASTLALTLPTYPLLFCLDRGNVEMLVFALLCFFFVAFERERWLTAAFWLGCATAMKVYPGVFAILFLRRKQWRAFFASIAFTIVLTLGSAMLYDGGLAGSVKGMVTNLAYFRDTYVLGWDGYRFNSSWFGAIRFAIEMISPDTALAAGKMLLLPYTLVCIALFAVLAVLVIRRTSMPWWQQVMLLGFPMILFPEVSFDYKLVHCFFPFLYFLRAEESTKHEGPYTVLLSLLFVPMAYGVIDGDVNSAIFLHPLLMTGLMLIAIFERKAATA